MKDPIVPLLTRFLTDRVASARRELADLCFLVLSSRFSLRALSFIKEDLHLIVLLILLSVDETDIVAETANRVGSD